MTIYYAMLDLVLQAGIINWANHYLISVLLLGKQVVEIEDQKSIRLWYNEEHGK